MARQSTLVLAFLLAAGLAGCGGAPAAELSAVEFRNAALVLVPKQARIIGTREGHCTMFGAEPSCFSVFFVVEPRQPLTTRIDVVEELARSHGWQSDARGSWNVRGSANLAFTRKGVQADVSLHPSPRTACSDLSRGECSRVDTVRVVRGVTADG